MADESTIIEVAILDSEGAASAVGRGRVHAFDSDAGEIILETPTSGGRPMLVEVGTLLRIFAISGGSVHAFETSVIGKESLSSNRGPLAILRLEAPEDLSNGNRRRHFRVVPVSTSPVELSWRLASIDRSAPNSRPWLKARVADISGRGVGLWIDPKNSDGLNVGGLLELSIQLKLPTGVKSLRVRSIIRRLRRPTDSSRAVLAGIEFEFDGRDPDDCIEDIMTYVTWRQFETARSHRERE